MGKSFAYYGYVHVKDSGYFTGGDWAVRVKTQDDINNLSGNFDINFIPYQAEGLRIKYFSRIGSWVYLVSNCPYQKNKQVDVGSYIQTTRSNNDDRKFLELGKTSYFVYTLNFRSLPIAYIDDLLESISIYLEINGKWIAVQSLNTGYVSTSGRESGRLQLQLKTSNLDTASRASDIF